MIDKYNPRKLTEKSLCKQLALDAGFSEDEAEEKCEECLDTPILQFDRDTLNRGNADVPKLSQHVAINSDSEEAAKKERKQSVQYDVKPKIVEKTFCPFCSQPHPTKILCEDATIKSFPLNSFHVEPEMQRDSLGLTREATNLERCVSAVMDTQGLSMEEAEAVCENLLGNAIFKHDFIDHPTPQPVHQILTPSAEDVFVAQWISDTKDSQPDACHPEMAATLFHKGQREKPVLPVASKTVEGLDNIYGKTKTRLIAETLHEPKYARRLTVGDIFAQNAEEKERFQQCVAEEMQGGLSRAEAEKVCKQDSEKRLPTE